MGLIFEEKTRREIEDGKRAIFTLFAYTDDFHPDNDEGCYTCSIRIFTKDNKLVGEYYRLFLVSEFNDRHYRNFINKFCSDLKYRELFNVKNDVVETRPPNEIDDELVDIIKRLNELGLKTCSSCQGTKDPWSDRPGMSDGHSVTSYISFADKLPEKFVQLASQYDCLEVSSWGIRSKKRKFNVCFADSVRKVIDEWEAWLRRNQDSHS